MGNPIVWRQSPAALSHLANPAGADWLAAGFSP